ncbi:MAG: ABC transporter permease [Desulfobacteraceae bacterium]|nr:MAG: ABC transporter permease [Desulfobacteraceae bacterium]
MKQYLRDLAKRKDLIIYLVISGLKAQHKNSFLGYFWWLIDPFLNVAIYYFVVVVIFQRPGGAAYGMYLVSGMIVWRWMAATVSSASNSILSQGGIISQVYLPKSVFPVGAALNHLVNFGFGLIIIFIFLFYFNYSLGSQIIWLPVIILVQLVFMLAISFPIAFVCVFIRDVNNLVDHGMRLWFFGSPVIWYKDMIPEHLVILLKVNPMYHLLDAYRSVFMENTGPDGMALLIIAAGSVLAIVPMLYFYSLKEHLILKSL